MVEIKIPHKQSGRLPPDREAKLDKLSKAVYDGDLDAVKEFHTAGLPWGGLTTYYAALTGCLDCLKYAHENGCPWNPSTTLGAVIYGNLDCLKYAHEKGCPWHAETTRSAAYTGKLSCLQYAHEKGCPWHAETTRAAAKAGQFSCLQYAHEKGCPWHAETTRAAAENGHLDCLQYADSNGAPLWEGAHNFKRWRENTFETKELTDTLRSSTGGSFTDAFAEPKDWLYNLSMDITTEWNKGKAQRHETYLLRYTPSAIAVYSKTPQKEFHFKLENASAPILVNHNQFLYSTTDSGKYRVFLRNITEYGLGDPVSLCHDKSTSFEKNWGPFDWREDGSFLIMYSVFPLRIFRFDRKTLSCVDQPVVSDIPDAIQRISDVFDFEKPFPFRGGTRGVPFYDEFLFVGHTTQHVPKAPKRACFPDFLTSINRDDKSSDPFRRAEYGRMYYSYFFTIQRNHNKWCISRMSACFQPDTGMDDLPFPKVVFPVGLVLENDGVTISYGVNDQHCFLSTYPREYVNFMLKPIGTWNENNYVAHSSFERYFRMVQYHKNFVTRSPRAMIAFASGKVAMTSIGSRDVMGTSAPGTDAFNPAISRASSDPETFLLAARRLNGNIRSWAGKNVVVLSAGRFTFENDELHFHQIGPYETVDVTSGFHDAGGEDPRLVMDGECPLLLFNDVENGKRRMYLHNMNTGNVQSLCHGESGDFEKNWGPFFHNGTMHLVYNISPFKVLQVSHDNCTVGMCKWMETTSIDIAGIERHHMITFRGGTPGIPYGDGEYLFLGHGFNDTKQFCFSQQIVQRATEKEFEEPGWHSSYTKMYWIFFYTIRFVDGKWHLNRISACSHLPGKRQNFTKIVFPCGLAEITVPTWKNKGYLISYGEKDIYSDFCVVSKEFLEFVLRKDHTKLDYVCDVNLFSAVLAISPEYYIP